MAIYVIAEKIKPDTNRPKNKHSTRNILNNITKLSQPSSDY